MDRPTPRFWSLVVFYPLLYGGLAIAAYSVYVGQVLSVRLVVRKAVRYAFARLTLIGLVLIPFLLLSWLVYLHRDEPLRELLTGPPQLMLLTLVAGAAVLLRVRRPLLSALDRRFFREQYDARHILRNLIESGRSAASLDVLAEQLASEISRALHVSPIVLFIADDRSRQLRPLQPAQPLSLDATLATLLKGSQKPMELERAGTDDVLGRLPAAERAWVAEGGYHLLVPITDGGDQLGGLIALGAKRSELPFSREDRWLLSATASSAALAIERLRAISGSGAAREPAHHVAPHDQQDPARECPRCDRVHAPEIRLCPNCGEALRLAAIPLTLHGLHVERRVGAGGMGVVYCATDIALRRQVAVKTLPTVSLAHAHQLRREARAMAALSHPNLATIYAVDAWRGTPLLLVEFLHGGTLQDALRTAPLPISRVLDMGVELAAALHHMHERSTLHRDIKPSNIGFTGSGTPKLLDFGLAKILELPAVAQHTRSPEATTSTNDVMMTPSADFLVGTPAYFSPELASLHPPDYAADLWALALTLYEAIAGAEPHGRAHRARNAGAHRHASRAAARQRAPRLPRRRRRVLRRRAQPSPGGSAVLGEARSRRDCGRWRCRSCIISRRGHGRWHHAGLVSHRLAARGWRDGGGVQGARPAPAAPRRAEGAALGCLLGRGPAATVPAGGPGGLGAERPAHHHHLRHLRA